MVIKILATLTRFALALRHFQVDYHHNWIDIWADRSTRAHEFLTHSRFAEVPLLHIDGQWLTQSNAILLYLAEHQGANIGAIDRELLFWEANRIGMVIPQLIEEKRVHGEGFGEDAVNWLRVRYDLDIQRLNDLLTGAFVTGNALSIADISIFGYTQWHEKAALPIPANVARWLETMLSLPIYGDAIDLLGPNAQ